MENVRRQYGDRLTYCHRRDDALAGADALAILTEWKHFVHPDFDAMRRLMRQPVIFDGRNLYLPQRMKRVRLHLLQHRPAAGARVASIAEERGRATCG